MTDRESESTPESLSPRTEGQISAMSGVWAQLNNRLAIIEGNQSMRDEGMTLPTTAEEDKDRFLEEMKAFRDKVRLGMQLLQKGVALPTADTGIKGVSQAIDFGQPFRDPSERTEPS